MLSRRKKVFKGIALLLALTLVFVAFSACAGNSAKSDTVTIRIAQQYGMLYAPVYVTEKLGLLEKHLPGANLEWSQLTGGAAINEALIAGQLDVGFVGIPPALIAWDKGADYRMAAGICVPTFELMVNDPNIKTIADFSDTDKIAVPGIGSIQHILLAMAAEKILGDANALDDNLVPMAHPEAFTALTSGTEIVGHFGNLPIIDLEKQAGCVSILTDRDAYASGASIVCVTTAQFNNQKVAHEGLVAALSEAIDLINARDPEVIGIIAEVEKISEEEVIRYLDWPGTLYDIKIYGAMGLARFMNEQGFIENSPESINDIVWEGVATVD